MKIFKKFICLLLGCKAKRVGANDRYVIMMCLRCGRRYRIDYGSDITR